MLFKDFNQSDESSSPRQGQEDAEEDPRSMTRMREGYNREQERRTIPGIVEWYSRSGRGLRYYDATVQLPLRRQVHGTTASILYPHLIHYLSH